MPASPHGRRRPLTLLGLGILALALLALAPAASADVFTPESGPTPNAEDIDTLYKIVLYCAIPIFLLVEGTLIWSLVKYRQRRDGPDPEQIRGNAPLEIGWTIGATVILVVLAVATFAYLGDIKNPAPSGPGALASGVQVASVNQPDPPASEGRSLEIGVNGQQYLWRYDYGDDVFDYHRMVVPTNTTVTLKITSSDVVHSWWIPELGGKADAVPGHINETWFRIREEGRWGGQCAELCGYQHADMRAEVVAVSPAEYRRYIARRKADIRAAQTGLAQQRKRRENLE